MLTPTTKQRRTSRFGFTLVEMLVSIALVLIIMVLLAQVFGLAAGTMEKNRATSANDQQARTFVSIFKGDVCARSFRFVYPFSPNHSLTPPPPPPPAPQTRDFIPGPLFDPQLRRGYFSISENDPDNAKDDVISFTVDMTTTTCLHGDALGLYGRAVFLMPGDVLSNGIDDDQDGDIDDDGSNGLPEDDPANYIQHNHNQPEFDDGYPYLNQLGVSKMAEVVYFLRNGNLYRRVMLLRDAYDATDDSAGIGQPTDRQGNELIDSPYPGTGPNGPYSPEAFSQPPTIVPHSFWNDFDYSAVFNTVDGRPYFLNGSSAGVVPSALENDYINGNLVTFNFGGPDVDVPLSLGIPHFRFGHNINDVQGRPREFFYGPDNQPGKAGIDDNNNGVTDDQGEYGAQGSDDLFIGRFFAQENAHSGFQYPGNAAHPGNPGAPANPHNRPGLTINSANGLVADYSTETQRRGEEILITNVIEFDVKVWDDDARRFVDLGHSLTEDENGNGVLEPSEDRNGNGTIDPIGHYNDANRNKTPDYGNRYDTWHPHPDLEEPPYRPTSLGIDRQPGVAGENDDLDTGPVPDQIDSPPVPPSTESAERGWLGTDDEVRLKAIQITVRYMDPQDKLVRHVTITESLTD